MKLMREMEVFIFVNFLVLIAGIMALGLIIFAVYNVVIRKKKVNNLYTPFDDATRAIKNEDKKNHQ